MELAGERGKRAMGLGKKTQKKVYKRHRRSHLLPSIFFDRSRSSERQSISALLISYQNTRDAYPLETSSSFETRTRNGEQTIVPTGLEAPIHPGKTNDGHNERGRERGSPKVRVPSLFTVFWVRRSFLARRPERNDQDLS